MFPQIQSSGSLQALGMLSALVTTGNVWPGNTLWQEPHGLVQYLRCALDGPGKDADTHINVLKNIGTPLSSVLVLASQNLEPLTPIRTLNIFQTPRQYNLSLPQCPKTKAYSLWMSCRSVALRILESFFLLLLCLNLTLFYVQEYLDKKPGKAMKSSQITWMQWSLYYKVVFPRGENHPFSCFFWCSSLWVQMYARISMVF